MISHSVYDKDGKFVESHVGDDNDDHDAYTRAFAKACEVEGFIKTEQREGNIRE